MTPLLGSVLAALLLSPLSVHGQQGKPAGAALRMRSQFVDYFHLDGQAFQEPRGVFFDRRTHEIYVADTKNNLVAILNQSGMPVFSFGYNGELKEPRRVMVDSQGRIYVIDVESKGRVKVFDYRGIFQGYFSFPGLPLGQEVIPVGMTVDQGGNLYFVDAQNARVLVYSSGWKLLRQFGEKGKGPGKFRAPADIAIGGSGKIYVTDSLGIAVQVFSPQGEFVKGWGEHSIGPMNFSLPSGITVDGEGRVYVADALRQDVKVFTSDGNFLLNFGGLGRNPGDLAQPADITGDGKGEVIVVEKLGGRVQAFRPVAAQPASVRRQRFDRLASQFEKLVSERASAPSARKENGPSGKEGRDKRSRAFHPTGNPE